MGPIGAAGLAIPRLGREGPELVEAAGRHVRQFVEHLGTGPRTPVRTQPSFTSPWALRTWGASPGRAGAARPSAPARRRSRGRRRPGPTSPGSSVGRSHAASGRPAQSGSSDVQTSASSATRGSGTRASSRAGPARTGRLGPYTGAGAGERDADAACVPRRPHLRRRAGGPLVASPSPSPTPPAPAAVGRRTTTVTVRSSTPRDHDAGRGVAAVGRRRRGRRRGRRPSASVAGRRPPRGGRPRARRPRSAGEPSSTRPHEQAVALGEADRPAQARGPPRRGQRHAQAAAARGPRRRRGRRPGPEGGVGGERQVEAVAQPVGVDADEAAVGVDERAARRAPGQRRGVLEAAGASAGRGGPGTPGRWRSPRRT